MTTSAASIRDSASVVYSEGSAFQWRDALVSRTAIPINSTGAPMRFSRTALSSTRMRAAWEPTLPAPSSATLIFSATIVSFYGLFRVRPGISSGYGVDAAQSTHSTTTLSRAGDGSAASSCDFYSLRRGIPHSDEVNLSVCRVLSTQNREDPARNRHLTASIARNGNFTVFHDVRQGS